MTDVLTDGLKQTDGRAAPGEQTAPRAREAAQVPDVKIHAVDFSAALPFFQPLARFVERAEEADFCISMNFWGDLGEAIERQREARRAGRPVAFWCAEDPNDFEKF